MTTEAMQLLLNRIPKEWGRYASTGPGWEPILIDIDVQLSELIPCYEVQQIKEKFGTLRFYWSWPQGTPEEAWKRAADIVAAAEALSARTCEECGSPDGSIVKRNGFWLKTLCPNCAGDGS